jgi:hypothetical protein
MLVLLFYVYCVESGLCDDLIIRQMKIPITPSGIETAKFWVVAQYINQLRCRVYV